jgi:hypothetical protein
MSGQQQPSGRDKPKPAATRVREGVGQLLDASGQRERAQEARTRFARALTALGVRHGISTGDLLEDWQRFAALSPAPPPLPTSEATGKRIAFVAPYGLYPPAIRATGVMTMSLKVRGAEVGMLLCDEALSACETTCILDYDDAGDFLSRVRPSVCGRCHATMESVCEAFGTERLAMSSYSSPELQQEALEAAGRYEGKPLKEIYEYSRGGVAIGRVVEPAMYRFFLRGTLADTDEVRAVALRFLRAGIETAGTIEAFIDAWRPDALVLHAPVYLIGGVALAVCKARGVRSPSWEVGYRRASVMASHKGDYVREMRHDSAADWDKPLTPIQRQAIDTYLDGRQRGAMDDMSHHPSPIEGRDAVLRATGLREGERLVTLFTNVVWDAQVYAERTLFRGSVDWMIETLRRCITRPDVRYVVRIHPAEVKIPFVLTQERMDDQIHAAFPDLPDNIVLIAPEDDLSSYSLAAASDLAVMYSSTLGLETMAMGVPTVVAGYPFYAGKGFGMEPSDQESYFHIVTHPEEVPPIPEDEVERARRWAYYLFFERMLIMPDIVNARRIGLPRIRDLADLRSGRYAGLDAFCDGVLFGAPFETEDPASVLSVINGTAD